VVELPAQQTITEVVAEVIVKSQDQVLLQSLQLVAEVEVAGMLEAVFQVVLEVVLLTLVAPEDLAQVDKEVTGVLKEETTAVAAVAQVKLEHLVQVEILQVEMV
jgi:hypothetical protein